MKLNPPFKPLVLSAAILLPLSGLQAHEAVDSISQSTGDVIWLLLAAVLVFFMQAGFAMVESGMTRAKNACNIMMKNLLDFSIGSVGFFIVGYAIMYGGSSGYIGWSPDYFMMKEFGAAESASESASWLFQAVFAATAATIAAGAMAERTKFIAYIIYSLVISAFIYPIAGHWIWSGDGFIGTSGMRDFAGSTVVHSVGAWAGLAGAILLGPRKGKFDEAGRPQPLPGHNMPLATLGGFILWFGWYGFNAGSTLAMTDGVAHVAVTTTLAAAAGVIGATVTTWFKFGKPDLSMTINGGLAGLVSITAGCASVSAGSSLLIGLMGGVLVVFSVIVLDTKFKIDDPIGAVSVHGICGIWGTIAVGLFGERAIDILYWDADTAISNGLFFGGGVEQLLPQLLGVILVFFFVFCSSMALFFIVKKTIGLRVSEEEEEVGLDIGEHGNEAYADFQQYQD